MGAILTALGLIARYWQVGVGVMLGALIAAGPVYLYGRHEGRQQAAVAATQAVAQAYKDRSDENATVDALDAAALCRRLGGLPDDCAKLRGMGADQSPAGDGGLPGRP